MKILHAYSGNMFGGVETMLVALARRQRAGPGAGHEFVLCYDGRLAEELRASGARAHALCPARFSRPWTVLKARRRLRRVLDSARPDIVICHGCWSHALFGPIARQASLPLVCWLHDVARGDHWIERLALRTPPDLAIACSQFNAESVRRLFPGVSRDVVHPAVPPPLAFDRAEARAAIRRELATPDDAVVIVHASRMEPWKGQGPLMAALAMLRDQPGWVAWIAGGAQRPHEAEYLERLRATAHALGIADRVRFAGLRRDVPRLLAAADIHCQPNTGPEPFGITFIEAMHARRPVVTTRLGGALEIVTPDCGVLVEPDDPPGLASALQTLIDDPETRARLGAAGPGRARDLCDPGPILDRLNGLMNDLTACARQHIHA